MNTRLSAAIAATAILSACSSSGSDPTPVPSQPLERQGIWERSGYGDVLVVGETGAELYQYTRQACLKAENLDNTDVAEIFQSPMLSDDGEQLITVPAESVFQARFDRLSSLPGTCGEDGLITDGSPSVTFDHLWHTFNDHYAFFDERGVDWNDRYATLQPLVTDDLDDEELLDIVTRLLEPLDDGHVQLNAGGEEFDFADFRGANRVIAESFAEQSDFDDIQDYANSVSGRFVEIRSSYLDQGGRGAAGGSTGRRISWGTIGQQVGYLRIARMQDISTRGSSTAAEVAAAETIVASALDDLSDTSALIVDVRTNAGGEDAVSLAIANHFADENRLAVTKFARSPSGDSEPVEAFVSPANETPYTKPVAVIGASDTSSAAEIFLMAMSALPQVTLVGENSNGILSDILSKSLPNGWEVGLSNEVYTDSLGVNHEAVGVPPQVVAPTFSLESIGEDRDAAIDASLRTLGFGELARGN